jgi:hypothetical protein
MAIEPGISNIHCRIYQPPKSSMQSGRAKTHSWMLEYEIETARRPEPFATQEDAIAFAEREGFGYSVEQPKPHRVRPRSYADNFRYIPPKPAAG